MRVFLIDFENMRSEGLRGIDTLTSEDTVVIFYSNNADSLTFAAHAMIMSSKANVIYYKIKRGGKNALDFQLISCLGYMLAKEPDAEFYVISKDTGYDFAIEFWSDNFVGLDKANIYRCYTIRYAVNKSISRRNGTVIEPEEEPFVPETELTESENTNSVSGPEENTESEENIESAVNTVSEGNTGFETAPEPEECAKNTADSEPSVIKAAEPQTNAVAETTGSSAESSAESAAEASEDPVEKEASAKKPTRARKRAPRKTTRRSSKKAAEKKTDVPSEN